MKNKAFPDIDFLVRLAMESGNIMLKLQGFPEEKKKDGTPVTIADVAINELVIRRIKKSYPHVSVIAEEGSRLSGSEYWAFCDPVDGTDSFCKGRNLSVFSLAIVRDGKPLSAVIYNPFTGQMWTAQKGLGCFLNGRRIRVSDRAIFQKSSFYVMWWKGKDFLKGYSKELERNGASTLTEGSVVYPGGLVAAGSFEGTIFPGSNSWEAATMELIVTEAGGTFTDLYGMEIRYPCEVTGVCNGFGHIASNTVLHSRLVDSVLPYL
ncbi:MAG: inositol monophosphatase [Candidatus Moranbacteria bacterium]|nr:inositol monophosphatase [Candidatus Moranbacteria bacterium]